MGTWQDSSLTESSGLAYSTKAANRAFTHNDENGPVHCVDLTTGKTLAKVSVKDRTLIDPESISIDANGVLWLADIGDNDATRDDVRVYTRGEFGPGDSGAKPWVRYILKYPGGTAHNAETFLINPVTGSKFIISKTSSGVVYKLPSSLKTGVTNTMTADHGPDSALDMVADGVYSPDGRYIFLLRKDQGSTVFVFDSDWNPKTNISMPSMTKPEGICITKDGKSLWVTEDHGGPHGPFQKVAVPATYWPAGSGGGSDPGAPPPMNPCAA